jgi:MYXO-CTERM domain-containing protein
MRKSILVLASNKGRLRAGIMACLVSAAAGCYALAGCALTDDEGAETSSDVSASSQLVISQVFGAGGNASGEAGPAPFTHDYVELFNRGAKAVELDGKAILYAPQHGNFSRGNVTMLKGKPLQPGEHFLVQMSTSARDGGPTAESLKADQEATGDEALKLSSSKGVVAITAAPETCVAAPEAAAEGAREECVLLDKVGYGAESFEGSGPAPTLDSQTAATRKGGGCIDTDDNKEDFVAAAPEPHNRASGATPCKVEPTKDGGTTEDAGEPKNDAGTDDDAGKPATDAGMPTNDDAGTTTDAGGTPGPQGPPGPEGPAGPQGPAGPAGPAGATGATGATGAAGAQGPAGAAGAKGDTGETGANGSDGAEGAAGKDGKAGPAGKNGSSGCSTAPGSGSSSMEAFAGVGLALAALGRRKRRSV